MELPFFKKKEIEIPERIFERDAITALDIIAPSSIEIGQSHLKFGERIAKAFFIFSFPRYISSGWLAPIINLDTPIDVSLFVHPIPTAKVLKQLRKKVTEVQSQVMEREEKGLVRDPVLEIGYRDLEGLRDKLQSAQERMFKFGLYLTVYGDTDKDIRDTETMLRSIFEARLIFIKPALFQQKEGFICCSPLGMDLLQVSTPMNTEPLSSCFPFISFDLSSNEGILYGINRHNNSLILFDRFSLENANEVVFGRSGSGKSYTIKLEILRYLMQGVDVIIIDPEYEYQALSEAVGGSYFKISLNSPHHLNPFDLPIPREDERIDDVLRSNVINLVGLLRIMLGGLTAEEDAIIDQALTETYNAKDITPETDPATWPERIPIMEDFEAVLATMEGTESLVRRVRKFTQGTYASFFNQHSNVKTDNKLVTFGIRDMEEELRPMAMFIVLRFIWNTIRSKLKKRILIVDEAWWLMQTDDGASFLFGTAKRARKYWLGITTITQDVADFMGSEYGQPIVANSSLQILMKQSPATIEVVQKTFNLTEEEKYLLLEAAVGEGLFFAGQKHVAVKFVASYGEDQLITTSPEQVLKIRKAKKELKNK
ncbi:VirB4-like conjugal transfer ATPase, CD1110 family [Patescibacteria group bacterium]